MSTSQRPDSFQSHGRRREVVRLIREIRALTVELDLLRRHPSDDPELHRKERTLEQLRWRLAAVARRTATDDLGNAA